MTRPVPSGKQFVDLAAEAAKPSRIRRDPPLKVAKKTVVPDREIVDRQAVLIGIVAIALSLVVIALFIGNWAGWSPRQVTLEVDDRGGY
ncbi:hypothetical protein [Sphingomonas alba]|uniref:Uncharacterized protein n=1 Tax=Sphingomonas alba TaxID=2908208 RepID=A0ABT0RN00_9SPHN|nr:hypothetical protein [Sphingomonas alba]MCL6684027.1 hypothetical protein [Sphingomonas alba]